jgi:hypothetical protein
MSILYAATIRECLKRERVIQFWDLTILFFRTMPGPFATINDLSEHSESSIQKTSILSLSITHSANASMVDLIPSSKYG